MLTPTQRIDDACEEDETEEDLIQFSTLRSWSQPEVPPGGGGDHRRIALTVAALGDAQGGVAGTQGVEHFVGEPARMAELEGGLAPLRQIRKAAPARETQPTR